jgi:hypothetical protein
MNLNLPLRESFSQSIPAHQLAYDSVSSGALITCPRYYQYSIVYGIAGSGDVIDLTFGIMYHSCLEFYDRCKVDGMSHDEALLNAAHKALTLTWNFKLKRPWFSDHPTKNRFTLIRSVVWYLLHFENDSLKTVIFADGTPAVEKSFRFELGKVSGLTHEPYLYTGHIDKLVEWHERIRIVDRKTTKYQLASEYFLPFANDNQMSGYSYGGKVVYTQDIDGVIIDAAQIGAGFTRFQRSEIDIHPTELDEWMKDIWYYIGENEKFVKDNYWPKNRKSCFRYNRPCEFLGVCTSRNSVRETLLTSGKYVRRVWDPLKTREV